MPIVHDPVVLADLKRRLDALTPSSERRWGRMSVGQMLRHCNRAMDTSVGNFRPTAVGLPPIPKWMLKFAVLRLPWARNIRTAPDFVARETYDLEAERRRAHALLDTITQRPLNGSWPVNVAFGPMDGKEWSLFMYLHLDHHLRQFSV